MSYVAINVLSVPEGAGPTLEERFAARQGAVDSSPGFERFALLRPVEGTTDYFVYTQWETKEHFEAWRASQGAGHGGGGKPAASGASLLAFEVVQSS